MQSSLGVCTAWEEPRTRKTTNFNYQESGSNGSRELQQYLASSYNLCAPCQLQPFVAHWGQSCTQRNHPPECRGWTGLAHVWTACPSWYGCSPWLTRSSECSQAGREESVCDFQPCHVQVQATWSWRQNACNRIYFINTRLPPDTWNWSTQRQGRSRNRHIDDSKTATPDLLPGLFFRLWALWKKISENKIKQTNKSQICNFLDCSRTQCKPPQPPPHHQWQAINPKPSALRGNSHVFTKENCLTVRTKPHSPKCQFPSGACIGARPGLSLLCLSYQHSLVISRDSRRPREEGTRVCQLQRILQPARSLLSLVNVKHPEVDR